MRRYLIVILAVLTLLAACEKAECETAADCTGKPSTAFTARCDDEGKCNYNPIPNKIGNGLCETGENRCTAPADCTPPCQGQVAGSTSLTQQCVNNECVQEVKSFKGVLVTSDVSMSGDKFKIDSEYNQPFNLKKDVFAFTIGLSASAQNKDHVITRAELNAQTKERRTVTIARKDINKPLFNTGSIFEEFILDFPADIENDLSSLSLTIEYRYNSVSGGKKTPKQGTLKTNYKEKLTYVNPQSNATCPASCDDKNPGTRDTCSAQTGFFCKREPIAGACGNFQCDPTENRCTCAQDCGPCTGSAGAFTDYSCRASQCVTLLKSGVSQDAQSIFDDRNLGPVQLNNNYKFNSPYNAKRDKFAFEFKIYRQDPSVSRFVIETVRLLEGQQQLAEVSPNVELSTSVSTVNIQLPAPGDPEEERNPVVGVWYMYVQNDKEERGNFQKPLNKLTVMTAE